MLDQGFNLCRRAAKRLLISLCHSRTSPQSGFLTSMCIICVCVCVCVCVHNVYINKFGETHSICYGTYSWEGRIREGGFNSQLFRFLFCLIVNICDFIIRQKY